MATSDRAIAALRLRLADAQRLIEIHEDATGSEPGRRRGYDVLNRSAVMLSIAAWEGFSEDILRAAVSVIATKLRSTIEFPTNVRDAMLAYMHQDQNWSKLNAATKQGIWGIADDGWRVAYVKYASSRIEKLNTPNTENLTKLFASTIGLADFSNNWGARRWSQADYITKLDGALTLRHRIAHGALGNETVGKSRARAAVSLVMRTSGWTASAVDAHVSRLIAAYKIDLSRPLRDAIRAMDRTGY